MTFVSLFAGIGGIDLGLERAGMTCVGQVEWESFPQAVLQKHWPDVPKIEDVRDFDGHEFGEFDLLAGGYPCQPFSVAGSRKGKDDIRHLWPEVHRIVRDVRPRVVLLENVTGHLSLGFGDVLGDLASCGYDAEWDCIPASAVGAPHRRDRVFIVATKRTKSMANTKSQSSDGSNHHTGERLASRPSTKLGNGGGQTNVVDTDGAGCEKQHAATLTTKPRHSARSLDSFRRKWPAEPDVGRVAHGVPDRVDRLKGLGNAVVPQVVEYIGRRILKEHA